LACHICTLNQLEKSRLAMRQAANLERPEKLLQISLGRFCGVVILALGFVATDLAVEFVDQFVDSGIQICVGAFCKKIVTLDVNAAFGALSSFFFFLFFYREEDFDIHHLVKMTRNPINLGCNVRPQRWGDLEVMSTDRQVHE
jgi:hypothetical protein